MAWLSPSILAFPRHRRLSAKYAQIRSYTAARSPSSLFLHSPLCGCGPDEQFDHGLTYNFISTGLINAHSSTSEFNARSPDQTTRAGALYVHQLQYHISFAFILQSIFI